MAQYRVKVQVVTWYEVIVPAGSNEEAISKAEALRPNQITSRGVRGKVETGLANPDSVETIDPE